MEFFAPFITDFFRLWQNGGILMWPLLFIAIFIYWHAFLMFSRFTQYDYSNLHASLIKKMLDGKPDKATLRRRMTIIKSENIFYFNRRLNFLTILTGVSPLMGLLGTVMGMLATFSLMNRGDAQKLDLMAGGISEALITTQMGLIIAVPAIFMIMMLKQRLDTLKNFFEQLESDCYQKLMRLIEGVS